LTPANWVAIRSAGVTPGGQLEPVDRYTWSRYPGRYLGTMPETEYRNPFAEGLAKQKEDGR